MTPRIVAYYRSRPIEPERSAEALEIQRARVRDYAAECGGMIVEAFTEVDGDTQDYPEFRRAVEACYFHMSGDHTSIELVVATEDPIGSGERFRPPACETAGAEAAQKGLIVQVILAEPLTPFAPYHRRALAGAVQRVAACPIQPKTSDILDLSLEWGLHHPSGCAGSNHVPPNRCPCHACGGTRRLA
jgi:hypothetical protein